MAEIVQYTMVVANHSDGRRFQYVGPKADCEQAAEAKKKAWKGDKLEVIIQKR